MIKLGILVLFPCLLLSVSILSPVAASQADQQYDTSVPSQYDGEYSSLQGILGSFNSSLSMYPASGNEFVYATELLPANGNRGPALLQANNLVTVARNLNTLQAMGVRGVTIAIGYPLLDPSFPNSAQYLNYFDQVVSMAHARGMKVLVESQVLFANTPYSPLTFDWSALPYSQYVANHIAQDQLIINQIRPDYLELGVEADTEAYLTGYTQLHSPAGWTNYIEQLLGSLNNGNTKLVAGAATWLGTSYLTGFANDPRLDMISTHVYPIYGQNLQTLLAIGKIAQQENKRLVIDEAWEQKVLQPSLSGAIGGPAITQQDVFSFWSPIDSEFLTLMAKFGQAYPLEYLSPFNEWYFFAYLNWTPTLDTEGYFQLTSQLYPLAGQNMASNTLTPTGQTYSNLARGTAPVPEFPNPYLTAALILVFAALILQMGPNNHKRTKFAT